MFTRRNVRGKADSHVRNFVHLFLILGLSRLTKSIKGNGRVEEEWQKESFKLFLL